MGGKSGTETAYFFRNTRVHARFLFCGIRVTQSLVFCVLFFALLTNVEFLFCIN
jgi:hypothetical protein